MSQPASTTASAGDTAVVRLADVRKTYNLGGTVEALAGVSLTLDEGFDGTAEIVGLPDVREAHHGCVPGRCRRGGGLAHWRSVRGSPS